MRYLTCILLLFVISATVLAVEVIDPILLLDELSRQATGLEQKILSLALHATTQAWQEGRSKKKLLTVIDYSLPSIKKRLWVIDLDEKRVLFHELVAHGRGSGENRATAFSNQARSLASSLGLYETLGTYHGKHGYSLKLRGLEQGFNDQAYMRAIVIHGAWYVSESFAKQQGRLGRSWGCPALGQVAVKKVIDAIKDGSLVFIYYPDRDWLNNSVYLR